MADEMAFHLDARAEHWERQGLPRVEAVRRARLEFGRTLVHAEGCRRARGLRLLDELAADAGDALRRLRAAPGSTLVAVSLLGLTMGATLAVFGVLDAVLLRRLPVERPGELRELDWIEPADLKWAISYNGSMRPAPGGARIATSFAYPVYAAIRDRSTSFADLVHFEPTRLQVGTGGPEQPRDALLVSANFLGGLGVASLRDPPHDMTVTVH
jgi:hypothetical protein